MAGSSFPAPDQLMSDRLSDIERRIDAMDRRIQSTRQDVILTPQAMQTPIMNVGTATLNAYQRIGVWPAAYGGSDAIELLAGVTIGAITTNGNFQFRVTDLSSITGLGSSPAVTTTSATFSTATFGSSFRLVTLRWLHPYQINEWDGRNNPAGSALRTLPSGGLSLEYQVRRTSGTFDLSCYSPHVIRYTTPLIEPTATAAGFWTVG